MAWGNKGAAGLDGPGKNFSGSLDAGMGLIYRLNELWQTADKSSLEGDIDKWNFILDRIFSNLCYRNQVDVIINEKEEIVGVSLTSKDESIYNYFTNEIKRLKLAKMEAARTKKRRAYMEAKENLYKTVMLKDIWLKKFMHELGLYLKEVEKNPSTAMFGGG